MKTLWFCWERTNVGRWAPVCYHGDKPEAQAKDEALRREAAHAVPDDCLDADGSPNFGRLAKRFPAPSGESEGR